MIPHLAWSVISTVKTNFIIWKILKIVLLPRNPWQHIAYLKLNQPKIKATKFPQKIVCGNATDTALYISANGNAAETLRKRETRPHFALTCFRPPEMWRKLEPSDFRKISEIRKRLISPCDCGRIDSEIQVGFFQCFFFLKNNHYPAYMYSVLWNRLIWQNSHDSQWLCLGWTSLTYPGCTARGFFTNACSRMLRCWSGWHIFG